MKQVSAALMMIAATIALPAQTAGRQTTPAKPASSATMDKAALELQIIDSENKINEAVAKNNVAAFRALAADSGWSVDPGGPMSVLDFEKNFAQVKIDPGWKISDSRIVWADTSTAVHTYKWTGSGTFMGQPVPPVTYATTVWTLRNRKWVAVFHQETGAAAK